jgi:hypothetical protein
MSGSYITPTILANLSFSDHVEQIASDSADNIYAVLSTTVYKIDQNGGVSIFDPEESWLAMTIYKDFMYAAKPEEAFIGKDIYKISLNPYDINPTYIQIFHVFHYIYNINIYNDMFFIPNDGDSVYIYDINGILLKTITGFKKAKGTALLGDYIYLSDYVNGVYKIPKDLTTSTVDISETPVWFNSTYNPEGLYVYEGNIMVTSEDSGGHLYLVPPSFDQTKDSVSDYAISSTMSLSGVIQDSKGVFYSFAEDGHPDVIYKFSITLSDTLRSKLNIASTPMNKSSNCWVWLVLAIFLFYKNRKMLAIISFILFIVCMKK